MSELKQFLIRLEPEFAKAVDRRARAEYRTRSDLVREALRRYLQDGARPIVAKTDEEFKR